MKEFERSLYELNRLFQYTFPGLPRTDKQVAVVSISAETQLSVLQAAYLYTLDSVPRGLASNYNLS